MHELPFADAIRPAPVCVLKILMLRYSVGHEIILLSRRNPLVCLEPDEFEKLPAEEKRTAVIFAADCCCQSWAEYHTSLTPDDAKKVDKKWDDWRESMENEDFTEAIRVWQNYRISGSQSFQQVEMPSSDGDYRYLGQPDIVGILNFLTVTCGMSEEKAFDYPLGAARMRRQAWLEAQGAIRIQNETDVEIERRKEQWYKDNPDSGFQLLPKEPCQD